MGGWREPCVPLLKQFMQKPSNRTMCSLVFCNSLAPAEALMFNKQKGQVAANEVTE